MSCAELEHAFRHIMRLGDYRIRAWWEPYVMRYVAELRYYSPRDGKVFAVRESLDSRTVEAYTATAQMERKHYLHYMARQMYAKIHEYRLSEMEKMDDR